MRTFDLKIVSHRGVTFEGEAVSLIVRGEYGDLAILSHHAPFLTRIKSGDVNITLKNGDVKILPIDSGVLSVNAENVMVLS